MLLLSLNVIYVLLAIAMIALILMQRGSGAQAGAGFGGGASGTVFGARGASNFLSKATKWLAIVFFAISMYMAWRATDLADMGVSTGPDLGVMSQMPTAPPAEGDAGSNEVDTNGSGSNEAGSNETIPAAPTQQAPTGNDAVPTPPRTGGAADEPAGASSGQVPQAPPSDASGD